MKKIICFAALLICSMPVIGQTSFIIQEVNWKLNPPEGFVLADSIIASDPIPGDPNRKRKFFMFREKRNNSLTISFSTSVVNDSAHFVSLINEEVKGAYRNISNMNKGATIDSLRSNVRLGSVPFIKIELTVRKDNVVSSIHSEYKTYYKGYRLVAIINTEDEEKAKRIEKALEQSTF